MTRKKKIEGKPEGAAPSEGISQIAAQYLDQVGGASGTFYEFLQFSQSAGQPGGPATGGGAFWQQVIRTRRLEPGGGGN